MKRALIAVSALALLGACAQQPGGETSQAAGVGIGAVTGAAIGAGLGLLVGGNDRRNAAVGAGIGAVAGGAVGAYLTRQEADLNEDLAGTGATVNVGADLRPGSYRLDAVVFTADGSRSGTASHNFTVE